MEGRGLGSRQCSSEVVDAVRMGKVAEAKLWDVCGENGRSWPGSIGYNWTTHAGATAGTEREPDGQRRLTYSQ